MRIGLDAGRNVAGALRSTWQAVSRKPQVQTSLQPGLRVAYVTLQFPKLSETFVVREINALQDTGWHIEIFPLWRLREDKIHAEAQPLLDKVRWRHPLSAEVLGANLYMLVQRPRAYLDAAWLILNGVRHDLRQAAFALGFFPNMVWIAYRLQRGSWQHVHAHFADFPALAAMVVHRLTGISYSFTAHAIDIFVSPLYMPEKVDEADFVVTVSQYNRQYLKQLAPETSTPIRVLRCGVRISDTLPPAASSSASIVCVGRLVEKKGQRHLVEACRLLRERGIPFRCTIIGGGPDQQALADQITAAGLDDLVILSGPRTAEEVDQVLGDATLFVLPSIVTSNGDREGIPVALMEAMAAGVPVISTVSSGIPELIEHESSGLLVPPADAEELARAIAVLLNDPQRRERLRAEAFTQIHQEFALDPNVAQLATEFARVLKLTTEPDSAATDPR